MELSNLLTGQRRGKWLKKVRKGGGEGGGEEEGGGGGEKGEGEG